jgi:hypothetical protein
MRFSEDFGQISNAIFAATQMPDWSPSIIVCDETGACSENAL